MNKYAIGAAVAALSVGLPAAASAQQADPAKVVVVDTQRIYGECTVCKTAQAQLQTQVTQLQQRAQQLGQPIQTEMQSIQQAAQAAQAQQGQARTTAETALQQRMAALQTRQNTANQELQGREQALRRNQAFVLQQINEKLNPVIVQVMQRRGANLAIDRGDTLAIAPAIDVTNDVLAALNQQLTTINVNAPAPAAAAPQQQPPGR
ncbi:OmpH/Skp family outer membrane protein [Sphingosinicella rhizophila]|uniref:OmpH family outer membrane protein n=1 Tax=Sphingosinicella rhizophila TaxID=3050082 RepID=A0ABU3Q2S0_9SPHN|nr:OmpH family outer membrane protein [Sphingosinicella sp. GR2756]MDT9597683.1 OmpH family outer membrane protein [Sphingosinicella sp. GR2756]